MKVYDVYKYKLKLVLPTLGFVLLILSESLELRAIVGPGQAEADTQDLPVAVRQLTQLCPHALLGKAQASGCIQLDCNVVFT